MYCIPGDGEKFLNAMVPGRITSKNFPSNYDDHLLERYHLHANAEVRILLQITDFLTESGVDYLTVSGHCIRFQESKWSETYVL